LEFQKRYPLATRASESSGEQPEVTLTKATKITKRDLTPVGPDDATKAVNLYEVIPRVAGEVQLTEEKLKEVEKKKSIKSALSNSKKVAKKGLRPITAFAFIVVF